MTLSLKKVIKKSKGRKELSIYFKKLGKKKKQMKLILKRT